MHGAGHMAGKGDKTGKAKGVTIVIRREEVVEGGHHGGAWKVAYADFVTAMMAFFLLMWLLNATTEEQRKGLADYFSPQNLFAHATSGSGKPFGGKTPFEDGALVSDRGSAQVTVGNAEAVPDASFENTNTVAQPNKTEDGGSGREDSFGAGAGRHGEVGPQRLADAKVDAADAARDAAARARMEQQAFSAAARELKAAVAADPALGAFAKQLMVDETPEGLRIQILDEEKRPMFATGSAELDGRARALLLKVAPVLMKLTERIEITGHTDAAPYNGGDKTNWELSTERANATRRLLLGAGLPDQRMRSVGGDADRDPLLPSDPLAAANRRIAIVVLHAASGG